MYYFPQNKELYFHVQSGIATHLKDDKTVFQMPPGIPLPLSDPYSLFAAVKGRATSTSTSINMGDLLIYPDGRVTCVSNFDSSNYGFRIEGRYRLWYAVSEDEIMSDPNI